MLPGASTVVEQDILLDNIRLLHLYHHQDILLHHQAMLPGASTVLLFQNGGLGGSGGGDLKSILPLLLLGGGGLGRHPGKGGLNPLLLSSLLGGCKEPVADCTPPNKADGTLWGVVGDGSAKRCCECTKG